MNNLGREVSGCSLGKKGDEVQRRLKDWEKVDVLQGNVRAMGGRP